MTEHTTALYYSALGESNTKEGWLRFMLDSYKEMQIDVPNNHSWEKTQRLLQLTDYDPTEIKKQYVSSYGDIIYNRSKTFTEPLNTTPIATKPKVNITTKKIGKFKGKALPQELRQKIREDIEQGILTNKQISHKYGITTMTVSNIKYNKPKTGIPRSKLSERVVREILDLRKYTKYTLDEIGQLYGISYNTVWQVSNRLTWKEVTT